MSSSDLMFNGKYQGDRKKHEYADNRNVNSVDNLSSRHINTGDKKAPGHKI